jgi:hypothetical protein
MNTLNEYIERRVEGMDYSDMYAELSSLGYDKDYIKDLINDVDAKYLQIVAQKRNKSVLSILDGTLSLIVGVLLLLVLVFYVFIFFRNGIFPGIFDIIIISFSFSLGSLFFVKGKKALKKASEKKIRIKNNDDLLD